MATARQFSVLYNKTAKICQDLSTDGISQAKDGINTVIRELTKKFKMPEMFKGYDQSIFVSPTVGIGVQTLSLNADVVRVENVWWIDNAQTNWNLDEIDNDEDWINQTDNFSSGQPYAYRYFQPSSGNANAQLQIWMSPNSMWISQSGGKLFYSYWAQLAQLVNDSDVPNLPYELDTILINGGVVEMARQQGDTTLIELYQEKYTDDEGEIRAWLINQKTKDGQLRPDSPQGTFGQNSGTSGYRIAS